MIDHEMLKNLPLMEEKQQHVLFNYFMSQMNNVNDDDFLSCMSELSTYCIKFISFKEMELITKHLVKYISSKGIYVNQIVELCGFYINFFDKSCQNQLFDAIMYISDNLKQSTSSIVAVTKFIRESSKVLSKKQIQCCSNFLKTLNDQVPSYLYDTVQYTIKNIKNNFSTTKADVLLLIPEFLTGSSFLQPPICMMQSKSDLVKRGLTVDLLDNRVYHYSIKDLINMIGNNYKYIVVTSSPIDQYQAYVVDKRFVVFSKVVNAIQSYCNYNKLIVCGSHGTVDYKMLLNDVSPDIILLGNYESRLGYLITNLKDNIGLSNVHGIIFREDKNYVKSCAEFPIEIVNWENSFIDYSLINLNDYYGYSYVENVHVLKKRWTMLQTTKGCPYNCIFCYNIYGKKVKYKNISNIIRELKQLERQKLAIF